MPDRLVDGQAASRFGTRAYGGSRNLRSVQKLLGHASIGTTEVYTAVHDGEISSRRS